jgi:hypothetical protein
MDALLNFRLKGRVTNPRRYRPVHSLETRLAVWETNTSLRPRTTPRGGGTPVEGVTSASRPGSVSAYFLGNMLVQGPKSALPNAVLSLAAVLYFLSTSSFAAKISLSPWGDDPAHALVTVEGDLQAGDHNKFRTEVGRLTRALVVFNSAGGNLVAGIEIGKTIRLKSFATVVLDGLRCASSCAFAWLGGSPRFMERGARIGFHAAYVETGGQAAESGVGNALLGSYLTQIGLSEHAVIYITQAGPLQMTWLTLADAKQIGIDVLPFETQTAYPQPKQSPAEQQTTAPPPSLRDTSNQAISNRAQLFVREVYSQFARTNTVDWLRPLYAQQVMFYGKLISRDEVLSSLRLEIERWPERNYRLQSTSINATCRDGRVDTVEPVSAPIECTVTGRMSWVGRSLARNAMAKGGVDGFTYVLRPSGDTFIIKEEQVYTVVEPTYTTAQ